MKNPYRQLKQLPLRNTIGLCLLLLLAAKTVVFLYWFSAPERFQSLPGQHAGPIIVGATGALDLLALFFVTLGWYDLYRRPWAILPSAILNLGLTALAVTLAALLITTEIHSRREMVMVGAGAGLPLLLALIQLVASIKLHSRIKPSAPPIV